MKRWFALIPLLLLLSACDVHELPHGSSDIDVTLHLKFDEALPDFRTIDYPPAKSAEGLQVRYELRIYRGAPGDFEKEVFLSQSLEEPWNGTLDKDVHLALRSGRYLVQAWVDFVGQDGSPFFDNEDFGNIKMSGEYSSDLQERDAFYAQEELPLETLLEAGIGYETTLAMARPYAGYRFLATDYDEFLQYWAKKYALTHQLAVKPDLKSVDINDFKVRIVYPQYLPNAFSVWGDAPVDSSTGVSFEVPMQLRDDGLVEIGADWVLQGAREGLVVVLLEFYDTEGMYISTLQSLEIPLLRGHLTTVQGKLLTSGVNSGITIDPTFDGEFNVYL